MSEPTDEPRASAPPSPPAVSSPVGSATGKVRAFVQSGLEAELEAAMAAAGDAEDMTYGDIVWGQFKKNRIATLSLWGLCALILLAILAPMIASTRPYIFTVDGQSSFPWFASLFDRNFFENPVDLFFNLLMVAGLPLLGVWLVRVRQLSRSGLRKRPRRRRMLREGQALLALLTAAFLVLLWTAEGSEYRQYETEEGQARLANKAVTAIYPPVRIDARTTGFASLEKPRKDRALRLLGKGRRVGRDESLSPALRDLLGAVAASPTESLPFSDPRIAAAGPTALAEATLGGMLRDDPPHFFGVDQSTRDVAVRMLYGTRISLTIGVIAVSLYVTIGIILGALAGFFGGRVDMGIQRLIEITMALPTFFVIITLAALIENPSIFHIMLIIGLLHWTSVARLTRGEFLRLRSEEFVLAATALGYPTRRIIFEHVLPNALAPVLISATFGVASAILLESTLSFLGLGDVSAPSWGQTLSEGYAASAWHLILAPGFAIFVTVSLLNLVGEGLRDALDPKLRK